MFEGLRKRKASMEAAALYEQGRRLCQETAAIRERQVSTRPINDLRADLWSWLAQAPQYMTDHPELVLAMLDVSRASIECEAAAEDWVRVLGAGVSMCGAVSMIRLRLEGFAIEEERELGSIVGAHFDETLYAAVRAGHLTTVGFLCDSQLAPGYVARQMLQTARPEVAATWLEAVSSGQDGHSEVMRSWLDETMTVFQSVQLREFSGGLAESQEWERALRTVDLTMQHDPHNRLAFAGSSGALTPLASRQSGKDTVYLIAGARGGAAVRFHGGNNYRAAPESVLLPRAGIADVRELQIFAQRAFTERPLNVANRSAAADHLVNTLRERVFQPIANAWPDMRAATLIPVGETQGLPYTRAAAGLIDLALAPNAASVLLASEEPRPATNPAVIMGDAAAGAYHLPWVSEEVHRVAAVYGKEPDRLIDPEPESSSRMTVREIETHQPPRNAPRHVLAELADAHIVHLACHGYVPDSGELVPELYLDGSITFDALEKRRLNQGACVVLSACSVGRNHGEMPLAQFGFPAMLLAVGAHTVIASSWPLLDCEDTVSFMVKLHQALAGGARPGAALREASDWAETGGIPSVVYAGFDVYGR